MSGDTSSFDTALGRALELARESRDAGEVPIGALVLDASGAIIGEGRNEREIRTDPTAHAEILALRAAATKRGTWRLDGCTLVVTLEPCTMCAGALVLARVDRVVFGAWNDEMGAVGTLWDVVRDRRLNHRPEVVSGVRAGECADLLQTFFASHRDSSREDLIG
ncbi:MAG: nucleoside deaminase [Actinomycetes bacterium]